MEARKFKLVIEYDGTGLAGWQRQKDRPTVQSLLEAALSRLTGETITVVGAGRTDAGVHAWGQVAHFQTRAPRTILELVRGGNALLPPQIAIRRAEPVPDSFHARYDAIGKIYDYDLTTGPVRPAVYRCFSWHLSRVPDLSAMEGAIGTLAGRHDFAAFQSVGTDIKDTVRTMRRAEIRQIPGGGLRFTFEADGFLRHMVRAMVGTLVQIGTGERPSDDLPRVLASRDRGQAGPTAPPQGLFLREVHYPPLDEPALLPMVDD